MESNVVINVQGIWKTYPLYADKKDRLLEALHPLRKKYAQDFHALRNVSLSIRKGEIVGIIGRNGSGKSTLLKIVSGVAAAGKGVVETTGHISALLELGTGFNPEMTGIENIYLSGSLMGLSDKAIAEKAAAIVAFADVGEHINQPVKTYSSGMYGRLAFATAFHTDPEILIIDEMLSVGDLGFQQKCLERIRQYIEAGNTLILVTHDIMLVRQYCTRAIYMKNGEVVADGDPETVGEQFIFEMRQEQEPDCELKAYSGPEKARFGNDRGNISGVTMRTQSGRSGIEYGDELIITINAVIKKQVEYPTIVLQVRDFRGYILYGLKTRPSDLMIRQETDHRSIVASCTLPVRFSKGRYSLSVGLTEAIGAENMVMDKLVGCTTFDVLWSPEHFHGVMDAQGAWKVDLSEK